MKLTISHVEVRVARRGWTVAIHYKEINDPRFMGSFRLKRDAKLFGRGVAKALGTEMRVTKRNGQYSTEAASYGNDPHPPKG